MYVRKKKLCFAFSLATLASGFASCLMTNAANFATGKADIVNFKDPDYSAPNLHGSVNYLCFFKQLLVISNWPKLNVCVNFLLSRAKLLFFVCDESSIARVLSSSTKPK